MNADTDSESCSGCNSARLGRLVVIRGNSGSGKTTVAKQLQLRFERGDCVVVPQDVVRREFLRESDIPDGHNIDLIRDIAVLGLARGATVVVEGILTARRYGSMLQHLASRAERANFYAFDLSFSQTLQRHSRRAKAAEFGRDDMRSWYGGWDPLWFVEEVRLDETLSVTDIVEAIYADTTADPQSPTARTISTAVCDTSTQPEPRNPPGTSIVVRGWGTSHTEHLVATSSRLADLADLPDVGASVTVDGRTHGGFMQRLEVSLAALRPDVAFTIHNHGQSGATSRDLAAAIEHAGLDQDLALIECGTNDVLRRYQPGREHDAVDIEEFAHNYRRVLGALVARSRRVVCLAAPPVHPAVLTNSAEINRDLFACNLAARHLAHEHNALFVDCWGRFTTVAALLREQDSSDTSTAGPWIADGIHLSPVGTELILRSIENALLDKNIIASLLPNPIRTKHTTNVVIRLASLDDMPGTVQLKIGVAQEGRWIGAEPPIDEARTSVRLENLITAQDSVLLVGEDPDAGIVASATAHFAEPGVAQLTIMIAADHRGHGVGSALLDQLIDWCQNNQAHKITLKVWPHNLPAIALYQRAGFDVEGTLRAHYRRRNGELWDAIIMSRLL